MLTVLVLLGLSTVIIAGGVAVGSALAAMTNRNNANRQLAAPARDLTNLRQGDAVSHMGDTYLVEGTITVDEHGSSRWIYHLSDGPLIRRWLYATQKDRMEVWLLEEQDELPFESQGRPPKAIAQGELNYKLKTLGQGQAKGQGATGSLGGARRLDYHHYKGPADHIMVIEQWDDAHRALTGRRVESSMLELLPGDQVKRQPKR